MKKNEEFIDDELEATPDTDIKRDIFEWGEALVSALMIIILLFAFAVRLISVSGSSMLPNLHNGDYLIVSKLFYEPAPGDVVVITKRTAREDSIVKRIIATEFQTVDIDFEKGFVYVDDIPTDSSFTNTPTNRRGDVEFPVKVPAGHIFVLGDNRNGSSDSRISEFGMIDERYIVGRALLRIWPLRDFGFLEKIDLYSLNS